MEMEADEAAAMRRPSRTIAIAWMTAALAAAAPAAGADTYGIPNATFPEPGVMAAGQPSGEQIQLAAEDGYRTIIDLRQPAEAREFDEVLAARQNGLAYVNIPVTLDTLGHATIDRFLEAMERAERPVLIHCGSAVRVGALYYAWLVLEKGVKPEEAMKRAKAAGLRSAELAEKVTKLVAERTLTP
jgi:uncharacterized protein (TIGR01244 family)